MKRRVIEIKLSDSFDKEEGEFIKSHIKNMTVKLSNGWAVLTIKRNGVKIHKSIPSQMISYITTK